MISARFPERKNVMMKKDGKDWLRMLLAFVAVLLVAGPGLVLAGAPNSQYEYATSIVILGPRNPIVGQANQYSVQVTTNLGRTFTDSSAVITATPGGPLSGQSLTPSAPGHITLTASETLGSGTTVTGTRGVNAVNPST
jgi:hypothetical protein